MRGESNCETVAVMKLFNVCVYIYIYSFLIELLLIKCYGSTKKMRNNIKIGELLFVSLKYLLNE